jgi:predicted transport protein
MLFTIARKELAMSVPRYVRLDRILLQHHVALDERWVQARIAEDPTVLGLGDLVLKDKERTQPHAGRLDLLLQDPETDRRYEVEVQLGSTDESHIIRTIEYWDIERKRYPQYEHCAVLVAEDITSRFLNVISLFNGTIPFVAIQMQALKVNDDVALVFTTVMDELARGLVDEDEEVQEVTDRGYWESRGSKATLAMVDQLLNIVHEFDPTLELKYNKFYIGLAKNGQPKNFVVSRPRKSTLVLLIRLKQSADIESKLEASGLEALEYAKREGGYRIRLGIDELKNRGDVLRELIGTAYRAQLA